MDKKTMWSLAAKNGLLLSLVTIVVELLKTTLSNSEIVLGTGMNALISIVKLGVIVYLLYLFMKSYSADQEEIPYGKSFSYGFSICLCSAIVCTVFMVFMYYVIAPGSIDTLLETMAIAFESSGMDVGMDFDQLQKMMPIIMSISLFINCLIFGLIIPAILANFTKKDVFSSNSDNNSSEL